MGIDKGVAHRPGAFKQSNKGHKHGRHRSKGSVTQANKGQINVKKETKRMKHELSRGERRHQAQQIRNNKREDLLAKKRQLGGLDYAPFLVCLLPLNRQIDCNTILDLFVQCDEEAVVNKSQTGCTHVCIPRFKQRFSFVVPQTDNDLAVLDTLKVADTVLFLVSAAFGLDDEYNIVDQWGQSILSAALAQGLPTPITALVHLESIAPKHKNDTKQFIQKLVHKWLPEDKLMVLDKNPDAVNMLRRIGNQKRKAVHCRDKRPHMYADYLEYIPNLEGSMGTLKVTGYLRGAQLNIDSLVHIPGLGDFQMAQIDAPNDPNKLIKTTNSANAMEQDDNLIKVLDRPDPSKQQTLVSENVPDPLDAEQTWPTKEDMDISEHERKLRKVKKVPKGWSDYQAAWIPEDDAEFEQYDSQSDNDDDQFIDAMSEDQSDDEDCKDEDFESTTDTQSEHPISDDKYDQLYNQEKELTDLNKLKQAKSDLIFPDEVDTPLNQLARERFQKYRGLESFRTSPWDPKENLPSDYARIFQFGNFDRTRRRIVKEQEQSDEGCLPGWYLTVHVKDVSQLVWQSFSTSKSPVVLIGLYEHEHKMSVVNAVVKRTQFYNFPIKSKERLIFQCGYRRFVANPIFSAHTNGQKHKFERFFQNDSTSVATFYAPIQFPPAPVLCYKEINSQLVLVATGSLLSCNPDRLIVKRIVLSGHPFKIHKRSAVVRFMFFNREDIVYFKPCKLRTKMGRSGHIKEPLGTHGHMKCVFDGQLKSQDTVLLNLYKRIFPKWTYEPLVVSCTDDTHMDA